VLDKDGAKQIAIQVNRDELIKLACDLVNIRSGTGYEKTLAEFILDWYRANGFKSIRQEVEFDRPNAVGILKGSGGGMSLMFNGHMDTSYAGTGDDLRMMSHVEPESELKTSVSDGKIRGVGISNMKGGLAAFMTAGKTLANSGSKLKGDLILAAVVGEISRSPYGPFQTKEYRGEGVGTRHLLTHGIQSDYAVVADGSHMNIVWTQPGVVQFRITTLGRGESAWGTTRASHPSIRDNAIIKMIKIIEALEEWGQFFEEKYVYQSPTGPILPRVNIGAIEGGVAYKANYFPGACHIYVDVRIPPELRPVAVQDQIERVLSSLHIDYDLEVYKSLMGYEGKNVEPLVNSIEQAYEHLFGTKVNPEVPARASIWTDTNVLNELGIPAVKIGPAGKRVSPRVEEVEIDQIVKAAQLYVMVALDICNRERPADA
jgi:acetylornithine deacetylase